MNNKPECAQCDGRGFYPAANGPEDFDLVACDCGIIPLQPMDELTRLRTIAKYFRHLGSISPREFVNFKGGALGQPTIAPF